MVRGNIIDKVIGWFNPKAGIERAMYRNKLEGGISRKYDGATKGRNTEDWTGVSSSSNVENQTDIVTLRNRSRELNRNNPYVKNIFRVLPNNIIGTGIIPSIEVKGRSGTSKIAKEVWKLWAEKRFCDYDQRVNFYGLQHLVMATVAQSGECLIVRRRATSKYYLPLRLQVLEADFIDNGKFSMSNEYGGITWYGVEFNKHGERVGYWLWNRHPGEFASVSHRVDAKDIIHVYKTDRPGQIRGVPDIHASMLPVKDLNDYEYTERLRAKVASCMVGAIMQDETTGKDDLASSFETMEPATFQRLRPGESVTFNTPPSSTGYSEYVKSNKHSIATGAGVTYEAMTSDYSNVNFSSARMGRMEFKGNVINWQLNVMSLFNEIAFEWFVEAAQVAGKLSMNATYTAKWTPPRMEMVDPYKETKALMEKVRGKFMTWHEAVMEMGDNPEEVLAKLQEEYEAMKSAGLKPESFPEFDSERKDMQPNRTDGGAMHD
jgi:lambda family phage portal protein